MKIVTLWKAYNPDRLFGGYSWHLEEVWDDWNHIYSDSYYVEIPDDFNLGETVTGETLYFRDGCDIGYDLTIGNTNHKNSSPYLIGGNPVENIKLRVIGMVREDE